LVKPNKKGRRSPAGPFWIFNWWVDR